MGAIEHPPIISLAPWGIPDYVFYAWIVMGILIVASFAATRRVELVPRGMQNFMEMVLEQFLSLLDDVIGHEGRRYLPIIATLGLFILTSNLMGLIPGMIAPTANMFTTAGLRDHRLPLLPLPRRPEAGLRRLSQALLRAGARAGLADVPHRGGEPPRPRALPVASALRQHVRGPHPARRSSSCSRRSTACSAGRCPGRSAASLIGAPAGLLMIAFTVGFLLPLKILVAFLQAFIFCMLSMLYIAGATEDAEHH